MVVRSVIVLVSLLFVVVSVESTWSQKKVDVKAYCEKFEISEDETKFSGIIKIEVRSRYHKTLKNVEIKADGVIVETIGELKKYETVTVYYHFETTNNPDGVSTISVYSSFWGKSKYIGGKSGVYCKPVEKNPSLWLSKECEATSTPTGASLRIFGVVKNDGDIAVEDISIIDDNGTPDTSDDFVIDTIDRLEVDEMYSYDYSLPVDRQSEYRDTAKAMGRAILGFGEVWEEASAECELADDRVPGLEVSKECTVALSEVYDSENRLREQVRVYFTGTLTNTGETAINDIFITDDAGTPSDSSDDIVIGPVDLDVGGSYDFSGEYAPGIPTADSFMDTLIARGYPDIYNYGSISASADAECDGIKVEPQVMVEKLCNLTNAAVDLYDCYNDIYRTVSALEVSFIAEITNVGDVKLIGVTALDDAGTADDTSDDIEFGPFDLDVGETEIITGHYLPTYLPNGTDFSYTDNIQVHGLSYVMGFGYVQNYDTATCSLCPDDGTPTIG